MQDLRSVATDDVSVCSSEETGCRLRIEDSRVADECGEGDGSGRVASVLQDSEDELMRSGSIDEVCTNLSEEAGLRNKLKN